MPTSLPITPQTKRATVARLTIGDTIRFFWLLGRSRWLSRRLEVAHRRLGRVNTAERHTSGSSIAAGDALLRAAERWLAAHEEIGALLKLPVPPHVEEMRAVLRFLPAQAPLIDGPSGQEADSGKRRQERVLPVACEGAVQQASAD